MAEWIVTSSVLILFVIAIRYFFRNRLALWARYALWSIVALRLLIPFSVLESSFSILNLLNAEGLTAAEGSTEYIPETVMLSEPDGEKVSPEMPEMFANQNVMSGAQQDGFKPLSTGLDGTQDGLNVENRYVDTANRYAEAEGRQAGADGQSDIENEKADLADGQSDDGWMSAIKQRLWLLPWLWMLGAVQCAGIVFVVNCRYRKKVHRSRKAWNVHEQSRLPVYVSRAVRTPCMFGLFHPAIYLTPKAVEDKKALQYVLCHENTHYRHRDNWWALVRSVCICIHWYNPLVWIAACLSRQDCELACDEETLRQLGEEERVGYGRSLLAFSVQESVTFGGLQLSTTIAGGKKQLKERLLKITAQKKKNKSALISAVVLAVMALLATFTDGKGGQEKVLAYDDEMLVNDAGNPEGQDDDSIPNPLPGEETSRERQHFVEHVTVEQKDGESYVLQIDSDIVPGSGTYEISGIKVLRQRDGGEEEVQSIHPGDVKALYTKARQDAEGISGDMRTWEFSSEEEPLFAKTLYSAEELPISAVSFFESDNGSQMLAYASNGGILVADLNFDGYNDFCVQTNVGSINIPYYCFLWNPAEGKFEHGSMIPNVQVDEENQCIKSITKDGESLYSIKYYRFDENNDLHLVRYVEENQSPDAVFPLLDLTYCENGGYDLPAVDDWDYLTEYGGALTERFVYWARQALIELYEWSGTKIDTVSFSVTDFGMFCFANSPEDMRAGRIFYDRVYGKKAGFQECIESMDLVTERVVWFSNVTQWNVPEKLHDMTNAQVAEWYVERSALAEGEKVAEVMESFEDDFVIRMESGNYYELWVDPSTREVGSVYGPYDSYPQH